MPVADANDSTLYDPTQDDEPGVNEAVPFRSDEEYAEDLQFEMPVLLDDKGQLVDAAAIEDTVFQEIECGVDYVLNIAKIKCQETYPDGRPRAVVVDVLIADDDGNPKSSAYEAYSMAVTLCRPDKPSHQVTDFFRILTPGATPSQVHAYTKGVNKDKPENVNKSQSKGFDSRKTTQFLNRMGFEVNPETNQYGREALNTRNWKFLADGSPRPLVATIVPGREPAKPKLDENKKPIVPGHPKYYPPRNQVKMFSYRMFDPDLPVVDGRQPRPEGKGHVATPTPQPTPAPAPVANGSPESKAAKGKKARS